MPYFSVDNYKLNRNNDLEGSSVTVSQTPTNKIPAKGKNILGYISLFILYVFIVIYAVLVQSIESAIAVIFLIISVICNITNPVHLSLKNEA